ncbi:MAG: serine/threonine protein kinase, partial [Sulfitobacter sp.]
IDVVLPQDVTDGFLTVSVLDVTGSVIHLLPHIGRPDNSVASLRDGKSGEVAVRVAYPIDDRPPGGIAFTVDDSSLGKSKILVLHSDTPLFEEMRPFTESAEGYAEALRSRAASGGIIHSLDSGILTTVRE